MGLAISALGWRPIEPEIEAKLLENDRVVMVYPHTSHFDFLFYLLYRGSSPALSLRCRVLVNPFWMELMGPLFSQFGAIKATRREHSGGGAVERVIRELQGQKFIFLISPKGARDRHSWRSGYYRIAKETKAKIVCAGFDYHKHQFVMKEPFDIQDMNIEQVESICKSQLAEMTPLHPQLAEYRLESHGTPVETSLIDSEDLYILMSWFLALILVLFLIVSKVR